MIYHHNSPEPAALSVTAVPFKSMRQSKQLKPANSPFSYYYYVSGSCHVILKRSFRLYYIFKNQVVEMYVWFFEKKNLW